MNDRAGASEKSRTIGRLNRRTLLRRTLSGVGGIAIGSLLTACDMRSTSSVSTDGRTDFAAPFAMMSDGTVRPLWALQGGAFLLPTLALHLPKGAIARSPWIDSTSGARYDLRIVSTDRVRVSVEWADSRRIPLQGEAAWIVRGTAHATVNTPTHAAGFRLVLGPADAETMVTPPSLILTHGVRIEPFPNYQRAAFAFSFDWESAMGGLIHSRSVANGEGVGTQVALRSDGGAVVAEAEAKGMRMRDGARFLATQFARHDFSATFYTTGYNLLEGNLTGERFLGNPIYPNCDMAHGWGSDWWRTHPWYGEDPFGTEATHPAWYFGSLTRELAASGHEIASHSFGHLYVRGVKPEQVEADLQQWQRAASSLGIAGAPSFAFPWTSSNSLDERFWAVFARNGMPVLTRLYPRDLRHPYELDRVAENPQLTIFPDFYLPSKVAVLAEALGRVEETLARRGYHSLWTHPNEVVEQDGSDLWTRVIDAVAAARDRGLWVAPVTEIALYEAATRQLSIQPNGGKGRIVIGNRSDRTLTGLTLTLPCRTSKVIVDGQVSLDLCGDQARLPALLPDQQMEVRYIPA